METVPDGFEKGLIGITICDELRDEQVLTSRPAKKESDEQASNNWEHTFAASNLISGLRHWLGTYKIETAFGMYVTVNRHPKRT